MLLEILTGLTHPVRRGRERVDHGPSHRLNEALMEMAVQAETHGFLASPVLGSAVAANRLDRLVAPRVLEDPDMSDEAIGKASIERFKAAGLRLRRDETADLPADDAQALAKVVEDFRRLRLPKWRMLGVVPG